MSRCRHVLWTEAGGCAVHELELHTKLPMHKAKQISYDVHLLFDGFLVSKLPRCCLNITRDELFSAI